MGRTSLVVFLLVVWIAGCRAGDAGETARSATERAQPAAESAAAGPENPVAASGSQQDSLQLLIADIKKAIMPVAFWRDTAERTLRPDSGTVRADTQFLQLRRTFQRKVNDVTRTFRTPAFQAMIWPDGAAGQQLRRDQPWPSRPDSLAIFIADSVSAFLAAHGVWCHRAEGDTYFEPNQAALLAWLGRFLTAPVRESMDLLATEQAMPTAEDAGINISPDQLAWRLATADRLLAEYPDASTHDVVADRFRWYLAVYLGGLPNTPAFDHRSGVLQPELRRSLEAYVSDHADTRSGKVVAQYLDLLEANGFRRQPEVEAFIQGLWQAGAPGRSA